jgi:peroxiredoxin
MAAASQMLPLGTPLPDFTLPDVVSQGTVSSRDFAGRPLVVAFICNHCPYVQHVRQGIADLGRFCDERGVAMVAISSNAVETHPQDGPVPMAQEARAAGYVFPYLFDESQSVAKAFRAVCTPEFYVFDKGGRLAYRGQLDDSRPGNSVATTGRDVKSALEALLADKAPSPDQSPSVGCSIKWKRNNAPDYS